MQASKDDQATLLMNKELAGLSGPASDFFDGFGCAGFTAEASFTIAEESLSPEKDEVAFRGRLEGRNADSKQVQSKFTLRLAKDKESGKWRVSFFTYSYPTAAEKKP